MGYQVLGFAVWQGIKWYLRRQVRGSGSKAAIAALSVAALAAAGAIVASRRSAAE